MPYVTLCLKAIHGDEIGQKVADLSKKTLLTLFTEYKRLKKKEKLEGQQEYNNLKLYRRLKIMITIQNWRSICWKNLYH
ncbi:hypothetical protein M569_05140 [Genlisea aurea]|uniref:Uncharacterized protein n=1 Tax=Genlisea aurea TaxID=192259 RepID=S8CXA9_9LAMI|nr:hypothetical protein M569_05140 [Genlisea aurea]